MLITGKCTLSIKNSKLDFEEISSMLCSKPTKIVQRGHNKTLNLEAPYDIWIYEVKFGELINLCTALEELLTKFVPFNNKINEIKNTSDVNINVYLRSQYAQIGFELSQDIINLLSKINIGVSFHILSFGEVEDN